MIFHFMLYLTFCSLSFQMYWLNVVSLALDLCHSIINMIRSSHIRLTSGQTSDQNFIAENAFHKRNFVYVIHVAAFYDLFKVLKEAMLELRFSLGF